MLIRTKQFYIAFLLIFSIGFIFQSCSKDCDCNNDLLDKTSDYELNKEIIKTNCSNFATGFETVFRDFPEQSDSASAASLLQVTIETVRFFNDESGYFFGETYNAWMIAHATKPELIGTYRFDKQDINGKYYVRDMVEAIKYKGFGFVDYYFENPETGASTKKLSFVKAIPVVEFFIGSGFYDYQFDKFYTHEDKALVLTETVTISMAEGLSGLFTRLNDSLLSITYCRSFIDHIRFFDNKSGYFFVYDFNGVNIAHGTQKDLQGKNLWDYQDSRGNYVLRDMIDIVKTDGSGLYDYYWNNPLSGNEEAKKSFVIKIPGYDYFIGSGIYVE